MAKVQTRRTVSMHRPLYDAALAFAESRNLSLAHLVDEALRAYGVQAPVGAYLDKATRSIVRADGEPVRRAKRQRVVPLNVITGDSFDRRETASVPVVTRLDLDAMAAARRAPPPGTSCANCIDAPATHRGRCDTSGELYWLCSECELPDDGKENQPWRRSHAAR